MQNTFKPKTKTRYDVILTGLTGKTPIENQSQLDAVKQWTVGARVLISGTAPKQSEAGYIKVEQCREPGDPLLREVFGTFMLETPAGKTIAICNHDTKLTEDASSLFEFIDRSRMGLAWAAYAGEPWPELFIMAGSILPHFFRDIPVTLKFSNPEWRVWLNTWLEKNLTGFRYFNGNPHGLIKSRALPVLSPVQNVYDLPEAIPPVIEQKPAKKRGMPKKSK